MAIRFKPRNQLCKVCSKKYLARSGVSLYCSECKKNKIKEWKWNYKHSPNGIANRKKDDRSELGKARYIRYRAKPEYKIYAKKRYQTMDENKKKARYYIHNGIRDGKLIKPTNCEMCGVQDWGEKRSMIEAHHYKGYKPAYWLVVQWLCTDCHKEADA